MKQADVRSTSHTITKDEDTFENGPLMAGPRVAPTFLWSPPPVGLTLGNNEVHIWSTLLELPSSDVKNLEEILTEDERERAGRFYFQKDRRRFIAARGVLRAILGRYLDTEPSQLCFCYTVHGKPELAMESSRNGLRFNVSHSHEVALYAVTRGRGIGIDVECIRPISEADQIAESFFSARENAIFRALPAHERIEAFFTCWTRKEAYLKALGDGLARPLDEFDVSLAPGEPARLLYVQGDAREVSRWSLRELTPAFGYTAALAAEGDGWHLECWHFDEFMGPDHELITLKHAKSGNHYLQRRGDND